MTRRIQIVIGNEVAVAELKDAECPITAEAVWQALPLSFPHVLHSRFAGEEAYFPVPMIEVPPENHKWDSEPGDIGFFPPTGISFYYGRLRVITPGNTFARVTENWEGFYRMCKQTWRNHDIPVKVSRLEAGDGRD